MTIAEPVRLAPYDPARPAAYVAEAGRILRAAGGAIEAVEHFGSTAVPGLSAKPTIDIMAAVTALTAVDAFAGRLSEDGYEEISGGFAFRRFFRKAAAAGAGVSFHLHLVDAAAWPDKSERLFRDWLRAHPSAAAQYAALKSRLAGRFGHDRGAYTEAKGDFIRAVVTQARTSRGLPPLTNWEE